MSSSSDFDPAVCTARLHASGQVWWPVSHWPEVGSTQDEVRRQLTSEAQPLHAFRLGVADVQHHGRGRGGARWLAPAGSGLLLTLGGTVRLPVGQWPRLSLLAGLAVLEGLNLPDLRLKWPNDLVVLRDGRWHKLAGLLCEHVQRSGTEPAWLCGLGLNLAPGKDFPQPEGLPITGLADWELADWELANGGTRLRRDELAARLAVRIRERVELLARGDAWPSQALDAVLAFRDQPVTLDFGSSQQEAILLGLTDDGGLRWLAEGVEQEGVPLALRPVQ